MPTPVTPAASPASAGIAGYDELPVVSRLPGDALCADCGCCLVDQPVRRDPLTNLLVVRCPSCSAHHSAVDTCTASCIAGRRVGVAVCFTWMGYIAAALGVVTLVLYGLCFVVVDELAWTMSYSERWLGPGKSMSPETRNEFVMGIVASGLGFVGLGFGATVAAAVCIPHWRRWGYVLLTACVVLAAGLLFAWAAPSMYWYRRLPDQTMPLIGGLLIAFAVAAVPGAYLGRPLVRALSRLFIPPRPRALLRYLWRADDKPLEAP